MKHEIPIGSMVEVNIDYASDLHGLRLWVVKHTYDCDGTPLYALSQFKNYKEIVDLVGEQLLYIDGFSNESLIVV